MPKQKKEKLLRRSRAAELLGLCPTTLRRYERSGILTPVKLNSRLTLYKEADILNLIAGEVETVVSSSASEAPSPRSASGTFTSSSALRA
jgi:MerR HTH family regulatory protein